MDNHVSTDVKIHAKPGMIWIIAVPIILVNINNGNAKTFLGMTLIGTCVVGAGALTAWMSQVPHVTLTSTGMTIRTIIGSTEVPFTDMSSWGTSFGSMYLKRKNGDKVPISMYMYMAQEDRQRLFAALQDHGITSD